MAGQQAHGSVAPRESSDILEIGLLKLLPPAARVADVVITASYHTCVSCITQTGWWLMDGLYYTALWYSILCYTDRSCGDRPPMETNMGIWAAEMPSVSNVPGYGYESLPQLLNAFYRSNPPFQRLTMP